MKATHLVTAGAAALITIGCAEHIRVASNSATAADVSKYVTYSMLDGNSSGDSAKDQLIKSDVELALADRGWVETSLEDSEAVVVPHVASAAKHSHEAFYADWGGWRWRVADAGSTDVMESYKAGTLVLDIFDAKTKQAIWRGVAADAGSNNPSTYVHATAAALNAMFKSFPRPVGREGGTPASVTDRRGATTADRSPRIIFSESPAVLVLIDGEPSYRDVPGTRLQRLVNTHPLIVRDDTGVHYLKVANGWMEAFSLSDPWSISGMAPEGADIAVARAADATVVDLPGDQSPGPDDGDNLVRELVPTVFVSTSPAELIVTDGEPQFVAVDGTSLLYIKNTKAQVFKEPTDKELYVRASAGWFRAWTTRGPWEHLPDAQLPADLMRMGSVLPLNR